MKKFSISIFLFLFSSLIFISCSETSNPTLDALEEVVVIYENFTDKEKLCSSEMMEYLNEVQPKITEKTNQVAAAMQTDPLSAKDTSRYLEINKRMQKAMMAYGELLKTMDSSC